MNKSGTKPMEYKILVELEDIDPTTEGGIHIPETVKKDEEIAQTRGILRDVGYLAFTDDNGVPWQDAPQTGDRVLINRYSGFRFKGEDGKWYRIVNDKDVNAVIVGEIEDEIAGSRKGLGLIA